MRAYWGRIIRRAVKEATLLMGWGNLLQFGLRVGLPFIAVAIGAYWGLSSLEAASRLNVAMLTLGVSLAAFVAIFLSMLFIVPYRIDREQRAEITELERRLDRWGDQYEAGKIMEGYWDQGNALLKRPGKRKDDWQADVIKWFDEVDSAASEHLLPDEAFMIRTLNDAPYAGQSGMEWANAVEGRMGKLRLVIARCYSTSRQA